MNKFFSYWERLGLDDMFFMPNREKSKQVRVRQKMLVRIAYFHLGA
jgi:hypothetical protein